MRHLDADVWVIHDPQPVALRSLVPLGGAAIWRCHIDCSTPNGAVREYLLPLLQTYDRTLFSMPEYVLPGLTSEQVRIVQPAIDPLARNRYNGYLVESTEDCAECMVQVLTDRMMAERIGAAAKRSVRERFLIPRLVQDHLQLYGEVAGTQASNATAA